MIITFARCPIFQGIFEAGSKRVLDLAGNLCYNIHEFEPRNKENEPMGKHGEGHLYKKRGRGCWRVRWTFEGKSHDESTGEEDKDKARKVARKKMASYAALVDVRVLEARLAQAKDEKAVLEAKTNPSLNLFRMIDAFKSCDIVSRKRNSIATRKCWEGYGNLLIDEFGGATEMRQLTKEQVEGYMRKYEKKVSPSRFNSVLYFFRRVWDTLKKYNSPNELPARLLDNPWEFVPPTSLREVVGKRPFTEAQLKKIWRVLEKKNDPDLTLLFDLARNTGARLHDLVSWKWDENVKFTITPNGDETKVEAQIVWRPIKTMNTKGHFMALPINDQRVVLDLYKRYQQRKVDEEYILPKMYELYEADKVCTLTYMCQKVFVEAGLQTRTKVAGNSRANCVYGLHSFRHTLASELFDKGVDLATIQHLYVGHGSAFMTELYAHANMDKKREDLSKLSLIDTSLVQPPIWMNDLSNEDKKEFDEIALMEDTTQGVKTHLQSLLRVKSIVDLTKIRDWIEARIKRLS